MTKTAKEWVRRRAVVNHISVQFSLGVAVGIERLRRLRRFSDHDVGRQMSIQCARKNIYGMAAGRVKVDALSNGVNAGVRADAGLGVNSLTRQGSQSRFQGLLNGSKARLRLPAEKISPVITQG